PPCSTLFPYTTLFRSGTHYGRTILSALITPALPACASGVTVAGSVQIETRSPRFALVSAALAPFGPRSTVAYEGTVKVSGRSSLDRKSTRLNSSHVAI